MSSLIKIGLTGGIGSGKSEVAQVFLGKGVDVINLDQVGRDLTDKDPQVHQAIVGLLGPQILTQGLIDRAKVRQLVFSDLKLKEKLEQIIHPKVKNTFEDLCHRAQTAGKKLVICEAALLIESGYQDFLDELIVVIAPSETRKERLVNRDKIPPQLAQQIIDAQAKDSERLKAATHIIQNSGSLAELRKQAEWHVSLWKAKGWI
ncbi:MAG: dephospho-CoA kinase [Proteobacteria bacterium]|nr:dephospho-CoA kinase [Pseudomonadota bacterium]NDC23235.1 dephospho-CoA kinase [Pseudomonadota bacterium]NDD04125.1 dephospho-CoA kinase [Pseudomonadota bacterium]NDG26824.1 dephospho-CoA kinase [Pseudomonadota bacterium]